MRIGRGPKSIYSHFPIKSNPQFTNLLYLNNSQMQLTGQINLSRFHLYTNLKKLIVVGSNKFNWTEMFLDLVCGQLKKIIIITTDLFSENSFSFLEILFWRFLEIRPETWKTSRKRTLTVTCRGFPTLCQVTVPGWVASCDHCCKG